ncbi:MULTISPECIES: hypothetical protein [Clostridium]|uniref:hypothetical protein n=1 Tax=Clostridium TaxID=1485 RepID=UPI00069F36FA|nr:MULTISPECIES: hypothetical protein [Clostridium]KOF56895.1 hypothetical protein AGR56_09755 [Clostridium sp. DMHC 10]MCD2347323.1 hypothetical protein [Clostridium guangxiense]
MDDKCETKNRLKQLENVVEKHTRTERHFEQGAKYSSPESIKTAEEKQKRREDEINTLEVKIMGDTTSPHEQKEQLEEAYRSTRGYIEHNKDHMSKDDLKNIKEKQANRELQRRQLEWK